MSEGYNCNGVGSDDKIADEFKIKTFCNQYPNNLTIDKLSTTLVDAPLKITQNKIKVFKTSDLNVNTISIKEKCSRKIQLVLKVFLPMPILRVSNLTEDECAAKCKENEICEYALTTNPSLEEVLIKIQANVIFIIIDLTRSKIKKFRSNKQ